MQAIKIAQIIFAETCLLSYQDDTGKTALRQARAALAQMIIAADGVGFAPPQEPTATDLAMPASLEAWTDCMAAASSPRTTVTGNCGVFADGTQVLPGRIADTLEKNQGIDSIGPITSAKGQSCTLKIFWAPVGMLPGRYPRGPEQPVVAPKKSRRHHLGVLALALLVLTVLLSLAGRCAFNTGVQMAKDRAALEKDWHARNHKAFFDKTLRRELDKAITADVLPAGTAASGPGFDASKAALEQTLVGAADVVLMPAGADEIPLTMANSGSPADKAAAQVDASYKALQPANNMLANAPALGTRLADVVGSTAAATLVMQQTEQSIVGAWVFSAAMLLAIMFAVGWCLRNTILGALIDSRNRLSLSQLQMACWTIIIFSLFYVSSLFLMGASNSFVLPVCDAGVWALLGIAVGSPVLSRVILAHKDTAGDDGSSLLHRNDDPDAWSVSDLFMGEENSNAGSVDLSRLQQFIITIVLMIVYAEQGAINIGAIAWQTGGWTTWAGAVIPNLANNQTFLGLLAVSHAGYLVFKGLPQPDGST